MKINILSSGRFHVLDLARELDKQGWDVRFYSFVPTRRAIKFGLPKRCSKSLIGILFPLVFLVRFLKLDFLRTSLGVILDFITSLYMRKCDVVIAMSGRFVFSLEVAKKAGSVIILERGSKHILSQREILEKLSYSNNGRVRPKSTLKRELMGYEIANYVAIASEHVKESFVQHNYSSEKLFVNPYGVSLKNFYPTDKPADSCYDVIFVGGWSYRKGCDLIIEAIRQMNITLLHVGGIVDLEFPQEDCFTHIDSVDEVKLVEYYKTAKVFVLPSREEGLALVQAQAIACGLPVVCSRDTGGRDLKKFVKDETWIIEMEETTVDCLVRSINNALQLANLQEQGKRNYAGNEFNKNLSWEAYGARYGDFLDKIRVRKGEDC